MWFFGNWFSLFGLSLFYSGKIIEKIEPLLTENQILKDQLNSANQLEENYAWNYKKPMLKK